MADRQLNYSVKFGWDSQKRCKRLHVVIDERLYRLGKADRVRVIQSLKQEIAAWVRELR